MQITVWRQFGSNHSSNFTIVGEFITHENAQGAADSIRKYLKDIARWESEHPGNDGGVSPLSPAQNTLVDNYGIDLERRIEWIGKEEDVDNLLQVQDNYLFLTHHPINIYYHEAGQAQGLVALFTDKVHYEVIEGDYLTLQVRCTMPDKETAETVAKDTNDFFSLFLQRDFSNLAIPWSATKEYQYEAYGLVYHKERELLFVIQFFNTYYGLPAFMRWLKMQGNTNLEIKFRRDRELYQRMESWLRLYRIVPEKFVIVGEFSSLQQAEQMANQMRTTLQEHAASGKLEWLDEESQIAQAVYQFGNLVLVSNHQLKPTWNVPDAFTQIMSLTANKVNIQADTQGRLILATIWATAPYHETLLRLEMDLLSEQAPISVMQYRANPSIKIGKLKKGQLRLVYQDFFLVDFVGELRQVIHYLEAHQCSSIELTFRELGDSN